MERFAQLLSMWKWYFERFFFHVFSRFANEVPRPTGSWRWLTRLVRSTQPYWTKPKLVVGHNYDGYTMSGSMCAILALHTSPLSLLAESCGQY